MKDYSKIIEKLEREADVEACFIVTRDGLLIFSNTKNMNIEGFAAMSATLLSSAEIAMNEIEEMVRKVVVEGDNRKILTIGAGDRALLAVITSADIDKIFPAISKAAEEISKMLG